MTIVQVCDPALVNVKANFTIARKTNIAEAGATSTIVQGGGSKVHALRHNVTWAVDAGVDIHTIHTRPSVSGVALTRKRPHHVAACRVDKTIVYFEVAFIVVPRAV